MGETPIILLPVVAPEPHKKSRTPSDFAIVAFFRTNANLHGPQNARGSLFSQEFHGLPCVLAKLATTRQAHHVRTPVAVSLAIRRTIHPAP
ncbi:hypothetical protein [Paraburkholderia saeva]|uniref:hypothetical protein n=1 Tax=Paraburkholderia saeva TaxID=2777537 RepID=UPI001E44F171|nr:hypothetical protein [Paraburkholderia saeva]